MKIKVCLFYDMWKDIMSQMLHFQFRLDLGTLGVEGKRES